MKTRSFLLSTLAVFIFAGCSSEDAREGNFPVFLLHSLLLK